MKVLVHFKHKSVKDYWSNGKYQHNKILVEVEKDDTKDDIERIADMKIFDIIDVMYPEKNGSGYDVCYQYEITKIDKNPYNREWSK